jgi:hypothetical protein
MIAIEDQSVQDAKMQSVLLVARTNQVEFGIIMLEDQTRRGCTIVIDDDPTLEHRGMPSDKEFHLVTQLAERFTRSDVLAEIDDVVVTRI